MAVKCNVCGLDTKTRAGSCSNLNCDTYKSRDITTCELLEKFIFDGKPPDVVGQEYASNGIIHTVFRWKEAQTQIYLNYNAKDYILTLARFMDFWGMTVPSKYLNTNDKKGGTGDGG